MKREINVCCICGKVFEGWGNNPYGALDQEGNIIEWHKDDVCCNECDNTYVLSGRLYLYTKNKEK